MALHTGSIGPYADCTGSNLTPRWNSKLAPRNNYQYYSNPRVDQILEQAGKVPVGPERATLCKEFDEILTDELPNAVLFYTNDLFAVNAKLHYGIPHKEQQQLEKYELWWLEK